MKERQSKDIPGGWIGRDALAAIVGRNCSVSWSGGKDACLAMYRSVRAGAKVEALLNMRAENGERSRSHGLRLSMIKGQAKAMGLMLLTMNQFEGYPPSTTFDNIPLFCFAGRESALCGPN